MNMSPVDADILRQLNEIENVLHSIGLYSSKGPVANAYDRQFLYCRHQMQFHEWLQWVMIPSTRYSVTAGRSLPFRNPLALLAEAEMKVLPQDTKELLGAIRKLDDLVGQA